MNAEQKKKIVAAFSGVMQYLEEEKALTKSPVQVTINHNVSPVWTSYGRQTTMRNGQMMQARFVRR